MLIPQLETNITTHCNNSCVNCTHFAPLCPVYFQAPEVLERDLAALSKIVHTPVLFVLGGEPLLHPDIATMIKVAHKSGIADKVYVVSNGLLANKAPHDFWTTVKHVRLSVYPNFPEGMESVWKCKAACFNFELEIRRIEDFVIAINENDGSAFHNCGARNRCFTVQEGKFYPCAQSYCLPLVFPDRLDPEGIPIDGLTEDELKSFLDSDIPFPSCEICSGENAGRRPWSQCHNKQEWIKQSTL
jgi:GTP 3',8-cyclase